MKIALGTILSVLLLSIANAGPLSWFWKAGDPIKTASVNDFIGIGLQYNHAGFLTGADILGRAPKEEICEHNAELVADYSYAHGFVTGGDKLVVSCLHVLFLKPITHGQVVVQPDVAHSMGFIGIGLEYTVDGKFFGAERLGEAPDVKTCVKEGNDTISSSYRHGKVKDGNSLLIYCIPVPPANGGEQEAPRGPVV